MPQNKGIAEGSAKKRKKIRTQKAQKIPRIWVSGGFLFSVFRKKLSAELRGDFANREILQARRRPVRNTRLRNGGAGAVGARVGQNFESRPHNRRLGGDRVNPNAPAFGGNQLPLARQGVARVFPAPAATEIGGNFFVVPHGNFRPPSGKRIAYCVSTRKKKGNPERGRLAKVL